MCGKPGKARFAHVHRALPKLVALGFILFAQTDGIGVPEWEGRLG
jgi:hypothetical protein